MVQRLVDIMTHSLHSIHQSISRFDFNSSILQFFNSHFISKVLQCSSLRLCLSLSFSLVLVLSFCFQYSFSYYQLHYFHTIINNINLLLNQIISNNPIIPTISIINIITIIITTIITILINTKQLFKQPGTN